MSSSDDRRTVTVRALNLTRGSDTVLRLMPTQRVVGVSDDAVYVANDPLWRFPDE